MASRRCAVGRVACAREAGGGCGSLISDLSAPPAQVCDIVFFPPDSASFDLLSDAAPPRCSEEARCLVPAS